MWDVIYTPWGAPQTVTGTQTLDARFPGQWFQLEAGLHYNWHRHYDPSLGRYTQPDPLGFVDGPSVYAYAASSPLRSIDRKGLTTYVVFGPGHTSVIVTSLDGGNALYDPGGSYIPSNSEPLGDGRLQMNDIDIEDYMKFQGPGTEVLAFPTTPEEEEKIIKAMDDRGGCFGGQCAWCTADVLRDQAPQFKDLSWYLLPPSLKNALKGRRGNYVTLPGQR